MSETNHRSALQGLCRLCGQCIQRRAIAKQKLANVITNSLSLDLSLDNDDVHPPHICEPCERKLARWKEKNSKKAKKKGGLSITPDGINIQLTEFKAHNDSCSVCAGHQGEPSLLSQCEAIGSRHGMVVQRRAEKVLLIALDEHGNSAKCLSVCRSGRWRMRVYGKLVEKYTTQLFNDFDDCVTLESISALIELSANAHVCPGSPDYSIPVSLLKDRPIYLHRIPEPATNTIRHKCCPILTNTDSRCDACRIYRSDLAKLYKRWETKNSPAPKANIRYMKNEKLGKRLRQERKTGKYLKQKLEKLKIQISKKFNMEAQVVNEVENEAFSKVMEQEKESLEKEFPRNSPQRLLWDEQVKANQRKSKGMRWHPAILRLCIALHAKSASAYMLLRESGFLSLPHQKTLYQYTHFTNNLPGFNSEYFQRICTDLKINSLQEHEKNIIMSIDEMKVHEGLVYSTKTGEIVGFTSLGTINDELATYTQKCKKSVEPKMASHVLVVMIRAVCASFVAPIAYFATVGATSDQLYWIVMESLEYLSLEGLNVRGIVSDGAAPNRGLYKILTHGSLDEYYFLNPVTGKKVVVFSDVPHLIKTIRNNFENSGYNRKTRNMKFRGLDISWKHIVDVYQWDLRSPSSLRMLHKLTEEHLHPTPALRMKVKLAAQVLSTTVANALKVQGLPHTASTITFIEYVDMFFDCLNVSSLYDGQKKRKPALYPYRDVDDWRFTWLTEDFSSFLEEWESEGYTLPISASDRGKLILSKQTMQGIRLTVKSFVCLCKELLAEDGVQYVLSDKFNQDPLEQYFAKQRSVGRQHENPSVLQFGSNMMALHVAGSSIRASKRANVTTLSGETSLDTTSIPRKRLFKKN